MKKRPEYSKELIGKNLRRCRQIKNFSVEQVREYLQLGSVQAIYKWEEGKSYPQTDTMFALMELYGIELRDLLYEERIEEVQPVNENTYKISLEQQFGRGKNHRLPLYPTYRSTGRMAIHTIEAGEFYADLSSCPTCHLTGGMVIHIMEAGEFYNNMKRCMMYLGYFSRGAA